MVVGEMNVLLGLFARLRSCLRNDVLTSSAEKKKHPTKMYSSKTRVFWMRAIIFDHLKDLVLWLLSRRSVLMMVSSTARM